MSSPCTVTATLNTAGDAALQGNAFVRFRLRNFTGFIPRIINDAIIAETQIDATPDSNGAISQTVWGNDNIDPTNTFYTVEYWNGGRITSSANYSIVGASFNLDTAVQLNPPPTPGGSTALPLLIETNGVQNGSQIEQNLHSSDGTVTLTDDGVGNIDFSAANAITLATILEAMFGWRVSSSAGTVSTFGTGAPAIAAAASAGVAATSSESPLLQISTAGTQAATSQGIYQATANTGGGVPLSRLILMKARTKVGQTALSRTWIGMYDSTVNASNVAFSTDAPAVSVVGFRHSSAVGSTWHAICTNGSTITNVDTLVAADAAASHLFAFAYVSGSIKFYIDNVLVATIATDVPTVNMSIFQSVDNNFTSGVTNTLLVGYQTVFLG